MTTWSEPLAAALNEGAPGTQPSSAARTNVARPGGQTSCHTSDRQLNELVRVIETKIVPRLLLIQRGERRFPLLVPPADCTSDPQDVATFAQLIIAKDSAPATSYVEKMRTRGVAVEALYLNLLAPAARLLGELWDEDFCDFLAVTEGLGRLQQMLRMLSPAFLLEGVHPQHGRRVLLVPFPGEQHSFGIFMVAEFFRRAGWDVSTGSAASRGDLVRTVGCNWFEVVGLSTSRANHLPALASGIHAIRRASRNPRVKVLVGGSAFIDRPDLVARVGADATAIDGRQATLQANELLSLMPSE